MCILKSLLAIMCLAIGVAFSSVTTIDILTNDDSLSGPIWIPAMFGSMFWLGGMLMAWWEPKA